MRVKPVFILLLLLLPLRLAALDSDGDQPIEVEADRLEVREQENISIYEGKVKLVQGSLVINSDRLVIHFNDANELTLMEMTGRPARFRLLDNEQREMRGQAEQIDYTESKSLLELRRSARFNHAGDTIESDLIRVNTENNNIEAGGKQSEERVKMLIKPKQNANSPDSETTTPATTE
ncbi:MAG: lipopolysaccharide transport periplasmic protein LptA [Gammaproteobacteria bacterium]|nr:lipopolysaccharide transport periplasmic protein LptA [Gammaproteobacteria bacterium]